MTISTETSSALYTGNGVTDTFPYPFKINDAEHLLVEIADANDENREELILDTDYSVTGVGETSGGNVVLISPLVATWKISIVREVPLKQLTDLENQGGFFPETIEDTFDYSMQAIQQLQEQLDRTPKVSATSGLTGDELIDLIQQAVTDTAAAQAAAEAAQAAAEAAQAAAEAAQAAAEAAGVVQEIPVGVVDSTDGINGNDKFILSTTPSSIDNVAVVVGSSVRYKTTEFILTTHLGQPAIQFLAGFVPQVGEVPYVLIFSVAMGGGGGPGSLPKVDNHTITAGEAAAKVFTLSTDAYNPLDAVAFMEGSGALLPPNDFQILFGDQFDWNGLGLDGLLLEGNVIQVWYVA